MSLRTLCIWLPNWPIQCRWLDQPELRDRPLVLHGPTPRSRGSLQVIACCPRAARLGIRVGQPVAEAQALAGRQGRPADTEASPPSRSTDHRGRRGPRDARNGLPLALAAATPGSDREKLGRLGRWCQRFGPRVALEEAEAPECLLVDVQGVGHLFGGEQPLAETILAQLERSKLHARVLLGDHPTACAALVRYAAAEIEVLPPGQTASAVASLPASVLPLGPQRLALLEELGLTTVGHLASVPRDALACRFGEGLLVALDRLVRGARDLLVPLASNDDPSAERLFDVPVAERREIDAVLKHLLDRLLADLPRGHGIVTLECHLALEGPGPWTRTIGLVRPSRSLRPVWRLLALRLDREYPAQRVTAVRLTARQTAALECRSVELFDAQEAARVDDAMLPALLELLVGRLGREAVQQVTLVPESTPELVPRYRSVLDGGRRRRSLAPPSALPWRPLRLLARPVPLECPASPSSGEQVPRVFFAVGRKWSLRHAWGPERLRTGWWRQRPAFRDYYRVETTDGVRLWLFRSPGEPTWYLHGVFD